MSRKTRTIYNAEFKDDAVKLVINQGYKIEEAADRLGVSKSALGKWVRSKKIEKSDSGLSFSEKEELVQLRKALKRAEMEGDILKKAVLSLKSLCNNLLKIIVKTSKFNVYLDL